MRSLTRAHSRKRPALVETKISSVVAYKSFDCSIFLFLLFSVSTADTIQVQYIQQGSLKIDTNNARWTHRTSSNGFMAFSYYGEVVKHSLDADADADYNVSEFKFKTPILINGSAVVEVSGENSLLIFSSEGIFIGVDIQVGKAKSGLKKSVGGYCVSDQRAYGKELNVTAS